MADPEEGPDDDFYERFADELEVLAELGDDPSPLAGPKLSQFRGRRHPPDEPDVPPGGSDPEGTNPRKRDRGCVPPGSPSPPTAHTPKLKRQRLEAVKKLSFGADDELAPDILQDAGAEAPSAPYTTRNLMLSSSDHLEMSGMVPLQTTPPSKKRVLKRSPILEDYVNVTSTEGTRVFMVLKDDPSRTGVELSSCLGWNARRPLHLLGVPFSYLKEQVNEERRRHVLQASQQLTEIINSTESPEPSRDMEPADEEESGLHCLWVDKFTPRRYMELLSDDYTNRCLLKWLKLWDTVVFGKENAVKKSKPSTEARPPFNQPKEQQNKWKTKVQLTEEILEAELDQHKRPKYKVALLCGPPGLGKTTLAHVIAKHAGYNAVEMNASDDRSPEVFKTRIEAATQMKSVLGANEKPNCLIIDEIDVCIFFPKASINVLLNIINQKDAEGEAAAGAGRRRRREGGLLLRPIICICNDQYVPALRPLRQQSFLLTFPRTAPSRLAQRLCEFLHGRGQKELNVQMVQTMKIGLKDQNKGLFSIWQEIFQLPRVQRHRIGMDPALPTQLLVGDEDLAHLGGTAGFNVSSQRFHHILHLATSSGEQEKLAQALAKLNHMQNLVMSMMLGITPSARSRTGQQSFILEVLCLLLDIIAPKLRPVNTQLYSLKEKQQLAELISTMLAYNLTYRQERLPEGHYGYKLDPNVEAVCRFPDLPARRQLSYQAKQLIAREIELEKMRRTEALLQARNLGQEPGNGLGEAGDPADGGAEPPNHQQWLEHIVRRAAAGEDKPETDFFGRPVQRVAAAPAPQASKEESIESQMGKAVGRSDVWFRFNEGVSNAVRRNIYIRDLL
ncbi:Chtf18 [Columba guinea]|nr:Chtf18 [Columba guinea]